MRTLITQRTFYLVAALLIVGAGYLAGSGTAALFTAQTTNPGNTFTTAYLTMKNIVGALDLAACETNGTTSAACDTILTATGMVPGGTAVTGNVTIQNSGNIPATMTLRLASTPTTSDAGQSAGITCSGALHSTLLLTVTQDFGGANPTVIYGPAALSGLGTTTLDGVLPGGAVDSWAATTSFVFRFSVSLPGSADNTFQDCTTTAVFQWDATQ